MCVCQPGSFFRKLAHKNVLTKHKADPTRKREAAIVEAGQSVRQLRGRAKQPVLQPARDPALRIAVRPTEKVP